MIEPLATLREVGRASVVFVPGQKRDVLRELLRTVDAAAVATGGGRDWFDVKLAVEEVCINLMEHGYGSATGPIDLQILADGQTIVVSIHDRAAPFSPDDAPAPDLTSGWELRRIGGLGWHLIRQVMDTIEYQSSPTEGNHLTLVRRRDVARES